MANNILISGDEEGTVKTWDVNEGQFRLLNAIKVNWFFYLFDLFIYLFVKYLFDFWISAACKHWFNNRYFNGKKWKLFRQRCSRYLHWNIYELYTKRFSVKINKLFCHFRGEIFILIILIITICYNILGSFTWNKRSCSRSKRKYIL